MNRVHLHDLGAGAVAGVAHRGPHRDDVVVRRRHCVVQRESRVAQAEAERIHRRVAVVRELPPAVPLVVDEMIGVSIEGRKVALGLGHRERQPTRRIDVAEQHVGERVSALHARVPGLDDGSHLSVPLGDEHGTAGDDRNHGARVRRGDGVNQRDVIVGKSQRRAVATAGEPSLVTACSHVLRGFDLAAHLGLGFEPRDEIWIVRLRHEAAQVGAGVADVLAFVGVGVPDDDEGDIRVACHGGGTHWVSTVVVHDLGVG